MMQWKLFGTILVAAALQPIPAYPQYEICNCQCGSTNVANEIKSGNISSLRVVSGVCSDWASTVLAPPGNKKTVEDLFGDSIRSTQDETKFTEASDYSYEYAKWSCMYGPDKIGDSLPSTCWAEGVAGDGVGEIVIASILEPSPDNKLGIWNGYGKSSTSFISNNRVRLAKFYLLHTKCVGATPSTTYFSNLQVIFEWQAELKDVNSYQYIRIPEFVKKKYNIAEDIDSGGCQLESPAYFVAIEILSVYKGLKYDDTCISEISLKQ